MPGKEFKNRARKWSFSKLLSASNSILLRNLLLWWNHVRFSKNPGLSVLSAQCKASTEPKSLALPVLTVGLHVSVSLPKSFRIYLVFFQPHYWPWAWDSESQCPPTPTAVCSHSLHKSFFSRNERNCIKRRWRMLCLPISLPSQEWCGNQVGFAQKNQVVINSIYYSSVFFHCPSKAAS